jgi:hypothetical protein
MPCCPLPTIIQFGLTQDSYDCNMEFLHCFFFLLTAGFALLLTRYPRTWSVFSTPDAPSYASITSHLSSSSVCSRSCTLFQRLLSLSSHTPIPMQFTLPCYPLASIRSPILYMLSLPHRIVSNPSSPQHIQNRLPIHTASCTFSSSLPTIPIYRFYLYMYFLRSASTHSSVYTVILP